jgi:hypothetical protein
VRDVTDMPKTTPSKSQECLPRYRAPLEKIVAQGSLKCHELRDANIFGVCLYFLRMSGSLPHRIEKAMVSVKGNHPLVWNTCIYWVR